MKAVAYQLAGPISAPESLIDIELPRPQAGGRDLLVEVRAVSVNPVDTKVRASANPEGTPYKVIGYDAVGVVVEAGPAARLFKPGDAVWYAGSIARPGTNSQFHLVDERIVGRKPKSVDDATAAALPLTGITAWELLFDRFGVAEGAPVADPSLAKGTLLVTGAAGGVGSILVQLARRLTGLAVVGTASRPETQAWLKQLGAHAVIDHSQPLGPQVAALGLPPVTHVASLTHTEQHYAALVELLAPQGKLGLIDDPKEPVDIRLLKRKALSLHWEMMFARPVFDTPDVEQQHVLLDRLADLVDAGTIRSTVQRNLGTINAANLKQAHALIESHRVQGKLVLAGW
ncbi:MAG: zinc-binding alcohol dehydrogenase family protein [Aquabacterium sp.]|nr:MAG: zinc-binding alcohol dehydrogenase family protein [Aquabacterium sp.]